MRFDHAALRDLGNLSGLLLDPDAVGDEEGWRGAVSAAAADLFRADHAYVQIASAPSLYVGVGIHADTFSALEREFAEASAAALRYRDPEMERLHRLGRARTGTVFTRDRVSSAMGVRVEDTRIYQEVCVPAGMTDFVGLTATTRLGEAMLWVSRARVVPGFAEDGVPWLEALRPAFHTAIRTLEAHREPWPTEAELEARHGLTPREAQVALLLARGASEKRVGRALGISPHTARRHTEKVFTKLSVRARGQVAAALLGLN